MIATLWARFGGWMFVGLAVLSFGYAIWRDGAKAAEAVCKSQFSEAITRQTRETLANQIREQALTNNRLRAQQDALAAERGRRDTPKGKRESRQMARTR